MLQPNLFAASLEHESGGETAAPLTGEGPARSRRQAGRWASVHVGARPRLHYAGFPTQTHNFKSPAIVSLINSVKFETRREKLLLFVCWALRKELLHGEERIMTSLVFSQSTDWGT